MSIIKILNILLWDVIISNDRRNGEMAFVFESNKLAEDLKNYRKENGLQQEDMASKLSINRSTLSQIETGKLIPNRDQFGSICDLLKLEPKEYFYRKDNDPIIMMMGCLDNSDDEDSFRDVINRIKIRIKYIKLHQRIGG